MLSGIAALGQEARIIKFDELQKIMEDHSSEITVINFWATWCSPCIKELPIFEKLNADGNLETSVFLVNLDFVEKVDRVNAFIKRKKLKSKILLLDEIDYNSWIDKVDSGWGGAIPATLIINSRTGKRKFVEKELSEDELKTLITSVKSS